MKWINRLRPDRREIGQEGERQALQYLQQQGLILLECNYQRPFGEIDLIMRDKNTLVFVEVRRRAKSGFGGAAVSITPAKKKRLILAAQAYLQRYRKPPPCRFDVVAIDEDELTWIIQCEMPDFR